jgi:hypothetical protein
LQDWLSEQSGIPDGRVGIVLAIHTFGDYLAYHPHIHCLATAGVFDQNQQFHLIRGAGCEQLAQIFRHTVLHRLLELKWISQRQADKLLSWHHHGFNINQGEAAIGADDGKAIERLAQYFLRAPLSLQKMHWNAQTRTVLYRSSRSWRTKRNFEIFSGPDFVAALYEHVPPKGFQTLRYYGLYSNKARGMRQQTKQRSHLKLHASNFKLARSRRLWRQRIFDIWGCDPLKCPCCGSEMRPHKPARDPVSIRRQLERLGLWEPITQTTASTPRAPPSTVRWILDAHDGTVIDLDTEDAAAWMPTAPRYKRERMNEDDAQSYKAKAQGKETVIQPLDDGLLLVIEDPDPWAQENEPIFWVD